MKILHVSSLYSPYAIGGAEKVVQTIAEAQARAGHSVGVTCLIPRTQPPAPYNLNGVEVYPVADTNLLWIEDVPNNSIAMRMANKAGQIFNPFFAGRFRKIVEIFRPDVIHSHSMVSIPPNVWKVARDANAIVIHTLHDYDMLCARATLFNNGTNCHSRRPTCSFTSNWKKLFVDNLDGVAAVSRAVLETHREYGFFGSESKVEAKIIWNAVDDSLRGRNSMAKGTEFTFGFLGRLVPEKGLDLLLEACSRLPRKGWRLLIGGKAPGANSYLETAHGLPIQFLGYVDPAEFVNQIDVLIVPSVWREPFGLTVIEGLLADVPVLGARNGAIPELVRASGLDDSWLFEPDPTVLAQAMESLAVRGRANVKKPPNLVALRQRVAVNSMVDAYEKFYLQLSRR